MVIVAACCVRTASRGGGPRGFTARTALSVRADTHSVVTEARGKDPIPADLPVSKKKDENPQKTARRHVSNKTIVLPKKTC